MAKGITRTGIVDAALRVLDSGGIEAVTVRAVAAELDVRAPALYHHVQGKQELLDEMGTEIQRRVVAALRGRPWSGDWIDDLVAYANALRQEYLAHRDGARTFSGTLTTDADVLRAQEPWLRRWVDAGPTRETAFLGFELVTAFVVGFVIEEQERAQSVAQPERYSPDARQARVGDDTPLSNEGARARADDDTRFRAQLRTITVGLRAEPGARPEG